MYSYERTVKSSLSDELLNTWILRPLAGGVVRLLYPTSITPNQVTIASTIVGLAAACVYLLDTPAALAIAGLGVTLKDVLDSADGQLARAKQLFSRDGRFLDSIGDFLVNAAVFSAMGVVLFRRTNDPIWFLLALLGLLGISLRVSYHVFYQVQFLHLHRTYDNNRVSEEVTDSDLAAEARTLRLQRIFLFIYGWQDRLVALVDRWCRPADVEWEQMSRKWYMDVIALRLSGFIGLGTELFLVMLCSVFNSLETYLVLNLFGMNAILLLTIGYRKFFLAPRCSSH